MISAYRNGTNANQLALEGGVTSRVQSLQGFVASYPSIDYVATSDIEPHAEALRVAASVLLEVDMDTPTGLVLLGGLSAHASPYTAAGGDGMHYTHISQRGVAVGGVWEPVDSSPRVCEFRVERLQERAATRSRPPCCCSGPSPPAAAPRLGFTVQPLVCEEAFRDRAATRGFLPFKSACAILAQTLGPEWRAMLLPPDVPLQAGLPLLCPETQHCMRRYVAYIRVEGHNLMQQQLPDSSQLPSSCWRAEQLDDTLGKRDGTATGKPTSPASPGAVHCASPPAAQSYDSGPVASAGEPNGPHSPPVNPGAAAAHSPPPPSPAVASSFGAAPAMTSSGATLVSSRTISSPAAASQAAAGVQSSAFETAPRTGAAAAEEEGSVKAAAVQVEGLLYTILAGMRQLGDAMARAEDSVRAAVSRQVQQLALALGPLSGAAADASAAVVAAAAAAEAAVAAATVATDEAAAAAKAATAAAANAGVPASAAAAAGGAPGMAGSTAAPAGPAAAPPPLPQAGPRTAYGVEARREAVATRAVDRLAAGAAAQAEDGTSGAAQAQHVPAAEHGPASLRTQGDTDDAPASAAASAAAAGAAAGDPRSNQEGNLQAEGTGSAVGATAGSAAGTTTQLGSAPLLIGRTAELLHVKLPINIVTYNIRSLKEAAVAATKVTAAASAASQVASGPVGSQEKGAAEEREEEKEDQSEEGEAMEEEDEPAEGEDLEEGEVEETLAEAVKAGQVTRRAASKAMRQSAASLAKPWQSASHAAAVQRAATEAAVQAAAAKKAAEWDEETGDRDEESAGSAGPATNEVNKLGDTDLTLLEGVLAAIIDNAGWALPRGLQSPGRLDVVCLQVTAFL